MAENTPENLPKAATIEEPLAARLQQLMLWAEQNDPNVAIKPEWRAIFSLTQDQIYENLQNNVPGLKKDDEIVESAYATHQEIFELFSKKNPTKERLRELQGKLEIQNLNLQQSAISSAPPESTPSQPAVTGAPIETRSPPPAAAALPQEAAQQPTDTVPPKPEQQKITPEQLQIKTSADAVRIFDLLQRRNCEKMSKADFDEEKKTIVRFAESYLGKGDRRGKYAEIVTQHLQDSDNPIEQKLEEIAPFTVLARFSGEILQLDRVELENKINGPLYGKDEVKQVIESDPELMAGTDRIMAVVNQQSEDLKELSPDARNMVNDLKLHFISGRSIDSRFNMLGRVIKNNGKMANDDETKEALHIVKDILTTNPKINKDFNPKRLRELAKQTKTSFRNNMQTENRGIFHQMAAYELAQEAEKLLKEMNPDFVSNDKYQGQGFKTTAKQAENINYENVGKLTPANLLTKEKIVPVAMTLYGGVVCIANIVASLQSKDPNRWQNPWIYGGAAMAYAGKEGVRHNYADSLLHPENRVLNELSSVRFTPDEFLIDVFNDPQEQALFRALDLSKPSGHNKFAGLMRGKEIHQRQLEKQKAQQIQADVKQKKPFTLLEGEQPLEKESGSYLARAKFEISRAELSGAKTEMYDFSILFRDINNVPMHEREAIINKLKQDPESNYQRFKAIQFLYGNSIDNADLPQLFMHAKNIKEEPLKPKPKQRRI